MSENPGKFLCLELAANSQKEYILVQSASLCTGEKEGEFLSQFYEQFTWAALTHISVKSIAKDVMKNSQTKWLFSKSEQFPL